MILATCSSCEARLVEVQFENEGRTFSPAERRAIQDTADAVARDARPLLPTLPTRLTLVVQPGKDVIAETGESATTTLPATVYWIVDPDRDVLSTIRQELRPTLFHEMHHLVRDARVPRATIMDSVISEGLATAFERDLGNVNPPWGIAPPENVAMEWTRELLRQPDHASRKEWLFQHPDGRRWIGMRVGTFLVDRAMRASGRHAAELASVPTEEILGLAGVRRE
jgi:uncharacterized protein YjaZ